MADALSSDEEERAFFLLFPLGSLEPPEYATSPNVPPPTLRPRHPRFLSAPEKSAEPGTPPRAVTLPASPTFPVFPSVPRPHAAPGVDATPSTSRTCVASSLATVAAQLLRHRIDATLGVLRATRRPHIAAALYAFAHCESPCPHLRYTLIRGVTARCFPIRATRPRSPSRRIAFVQHWRARPQYRHDRPSTTIVFMESHCTSHSPQYLP
ncbi:hypothetical protein B0H14DRAFT_2789144, partial [Mycena olivaceomarginata]